MLSRSDVRAHVKTLRERARAYREKADACDAQADAFEAALSIHTGAAPTSPPNTSNAAKAPYAAAQAPTRRKKRKRPSAANPVPEGHRPADLIRAHALSVLGPDAARARSARQIAQALRLQSAPLRDARSEEEVLRQVYATLQPWDKFRRTCPGIRRVRVSVKGRETWRFYVDESAWLAKQG